MGLGLFPASRERGVLAVQLFASAVGHPRSVGGLPGPPQALVEVTLLPVMLRRLKEICNFAVLADRRNFIFYVVFWKIT